MPTIGPLPIEKGLNTDTSVYGTPSGQAIRLQDMRINGGRLFPRNDQVFTKNSAALNSGATVQSLHFWNDPTQFSTGTHRTTIIARSGTKLYTADWAVDDTAQTFTDVTGTISLVGSTANDFSASLNGIFIMTFGEGGKPPAKLSTYNGNFAALGGSPPSGKYCLMVNNILFISGVNTASNLLSRIYWSNASDPETWGAANNLDFRFNDGDFVNGLGSIGNDLYIFKTHSIGRLSTTFQTTGSTVTLGPIVEVTNRYGTLNQALIDNLPDGRIVFLGSDLHVYIFDGNTFTDLSKRPIPSTSVQKGIFNSSIAFADFIPTNIPSAWVRVYQSKNEIWVGVIGADPSTTNQPTTTPSYVYIYNYIEDCWTTGILSDTIFCSGRVGMVRPNPRLGYVDRLLYGDKSGNIKNLDYEAGAGSSNTAEAVATFPIAYNFFPRFLLINISVMRNQGTLTASVDWDNSGTFTTVYSNSGVLTTQAGNIVVPLPQKVPNVGGYRPSTIQVRITITGIGFFGSNGTVINWQGAGIEINSIALSDEELQ